MPREYFAAFHEAIERAEIHGNVVVSVLPEVQYPDMVAEVADFLLRLDEVEWAWRVVDPILREWQSSRDYINTYPAGTWGPRDANRLFEREDQFWRSEI